METKHTPGPWATRVSYDGNEFIDIESSDKIFISSIVIKTDEDEANAKLIAAAPDLLEALLNIMGDVLEHVHPDDYKKARAAIKKATE